LSEGDIEIITALKSETKRRMLVLLAENSVTTVNEIVDVAGLNPKTVYYHVKHLEELGIVKKLDG